MFVYLVLFCAVISPAVYSVAQITYSANTCSKDELACGDGSCVNFRTLCNEYPDCLNGLDEMYCARDGVGPVSVTSFFSQLNQALDKQDAEIDLRETRWKCPDGTRITIDRKCDGKVDCPNRGDETHALCRKTECPPNRFRCTYGACVDGTAPCNDVIDCVDQSDELLPRCRNETDDFQGEFRCQDGWTIPESNHCDGNRDCPDGSDETVRACAAKTCTSNQFQCAYGACVEQGSDCNWKRDCADKSDESDELCNRQLPTNSKNSYGPTKSGNCFLPPYPEHGTYVSSQPNGRPRQGFSSLFLNITCHEGYMLESNIWHKILDNDATIIISCHDGRWSRSFPKCVRTHTHEQKSEQKRLCKLDTDPSVHYYCLVTDFTEEDHRDCNTFEPSGTIVKPECNSPNYNSVKTLSLMICIDGSWNYVAVCEPECGRVTPDGVALIIDGRSAKRGELPWHVGIYKKNTEPYMQICGGSLVSNSVVISAAHCFWHDIIKQQPASMYAVAVGKIYRPWNNDRDVDAQKSDVKEIKMPVRFQGSAANFQDDIAVIILETAFVYQTYVRPICLDFDIDFDERQLQPGKLGKVAGWGLTAENGEASQILKVVEMPYVDIKQCIRLSPLSFREYITSDKICSGYGHGTALCRGDSGGGLAFLESDRYYLRGIVSTAPNNDHLCNSNTFTTFTKIIKHEHFITKYL